MSDNGNTVTPGNVTLKPEHWAMIDSHAKDSGLISRSAGLRDIIDQWAKDRRVKDAGGESGA